MDLRLPKQEVGFTLVPRVWLVPFCLVCLLIAFPHAAAIAQQGLPQPFFEQVEIDTEPPSQIPRPLPNTTEGLPLVNEAGQESSITGPSDQDPVTLRASYGQTWRQGDKRVHVLRGLCDVAQGPSRMSAQQLVVWENSIDIDGKPARHLQIYAEGNVTLSQSGSSDERSSVLVDIYSSVDVNFDVSHAVEMPQPAPDALYQRALDHLQALDKRNLVQTQLELPAPGPTFPQTVPTPQPIAPQTTQGLRRVLISPRSSVPYNVRSRLSRETSPPQQVTVITRGVNVLIQGVPEVGLVDLTADRVVIWTEAEQDGTFRPEMFQSPAAPLQIYLEGNIEIRQGQNLVQATHAFYDAREDRALLLNGELRVFVPELQRDLRVRADRLRQLSKDRFHAQNAWATASQFGRPSYRLQADDIFVENRVVQPWLGRPEMNLDPLTGLPNTDSEWYLTSINNRFLIHEAPVFFSPYLSGPAEDPTIPLRRLEVSQDRIFGGQLLTVWDMSKLLNIETPGATWNLRVDGYTERGGGIGTEFDYRGFGLFGWPGPYMGELDAYYVHDDGDDNLGLDRRDLAPEDNDRGHFLWRHRQGLPYEMALTGEIGYLSDRNYWEQYFEPEWDKQKDVETNLQLSQQADNLEWSIFGRVQLNDFEYETEWLPRGDLTVLGEPILGSPLLWSSRSTLGYGRIQPAIDPGGDDLFDPIPFFPSGAEGIVTQTRHELSLPFQIFALQITPYVLGEAAYWEEDGFTGSNLERFYGSAGIRATLPFWRIFPTIRSEIFGLRGLAHKHELGIDYYIADAGESIDGIPQYNEFDDNAQERFRTRLFQNTFNGALFPQFDPRNFAVRSGAARSVSDPYFELVDDQHVARMTWKHRLQTKVGPPDRIRIKDWMTLDLGVTYFIDEEENFGEDFGLLTANYMWDIGARTRILANGQFDFFEDAASVVDFGILNQRSDRGSLYVGYRSVQGGPLDSQMVTTSFSYATSPKWIFTFGTAYDIGEGEDRGQSLTVTRVGADFVWNLGAGVDISKNNVGITFSIEPRLGTNRSSQTQLSSLLRVQ